MFSKKSTAVVITVTHLTKKNKYTLPVGNRDDTMQCSFNLV